MLDKGVHWVAKKSLNRFAFSVKSDKILLFTNNGGVKGILLTLKKDLKLVSTIFYQIFIFLPNDSPLKAEKCFLFNLKNFSFSRYSNFCDFFLSFPHFADSKGQLEVG